MFFPQNICFIMYGKHILYISPTHSLSHIVCTHVNVVSSSPLLSLVQVPAKLAINLSIHTQHTYDNGVDRTGDRVFRKYCFLHEEREEEKIFFLTPRLCSIWSTV